MPAGKYRHYCEVQEDCRPEDGVGGFASVWEVTRHVWAEITPLSIQERMRGMQVGHEASHKIRLQYDARFCDLTRPFRLKLGVRVFHNLGILTVAERQQEIMLFAQEIRERQEAA